LFNQEGDVFLVPSLDLLLVDYGIR